MRSMWMMCALISVSGCKTENNLQGFGDAWGEPNPRDYEAPWYRDSIKQIIKPEVDVLWVLDNSSSMIEEANKVQENFPTFLDYFLGSGLDYHIGIISTNMELEGHKGRLQESAGYRWIDEETADPTTVFNDMVPFYPGASHEESGREAIYASMEWETDFNEGFYRDDSSLHIIVISDEDDHSTTPTRDEFVQYLEELKEPGDITFSSIVGVQTPCNGSNQRGVDYMAVTEEVGGVEWSICEPDWLPAVEMLGLQAAGLRKEYFLSHLPVVETLAVSEITPEGVTLEFDEGTDWTYNQTRNSVLFLEHTPSPLSELVVDYQIIAAD